MKQVIKNEVGCRDDTTTKLYIQEGTARRIESMQQSSATPSLHLWFLGVVEDCCMLSFLLAVPSCRYSFWHSVIPTSYFIFILVYIATCSRPSPLRARFDLRGREWGRPGLTDHVMGMRRCPRSSSGESQGQATGKRRGTGVPATSLLAMGHVAIRTYITVGR